VDLVLLGDSGESIVRTKDKTTWTIVWLTFLDGRKPGASKAHKLHVACITAHATGTQGVGWSTAQCPMPVVVDAARRGLQLSHYSARLVPSAGELAQIIIIWPCGIKGKRR
jgi:hypothetical protein